MPPLYQSTTARTTLESLDATLRAALLAHTDERQLQLTNSSYWLTHSRNPPGTGLIARMFGRRSNPVDPDPEHWTLIVLHPTQLLLGTLRAGRAVILSLPLQLASVSTQNAALLALGGVGEQGLCVSGLPGEHGQPGTFMAKLGQDADGAECYREVERAIARAKSGG